MIQMWAIFQCLAIISGDYISVSEPQADRQPSNGESGEIGSFKVARIAFKGSQGS